MSSSTSWQDHELALIVADYFAMWQKELRGEPYNKTLHRKNLQALLTQRNESAIEFKHQNISAVLQRPDINLPYIIGYKPRVNYQSILVEAVIDYLNTSGHTCYQLLRNNLATPIIQPSEISEIQKPESAPQIKEIPILSYQAKPKNKIDYVAREQANQVLGLAGEQWIIEYEKRYLIKHKRPDLAQKIQHVSLEDDGAGFDILSFNLEGAEKKLEVKTTRYGKETPFYLSPNELKTSQQQSEHYQLCRLYQFTTAAKFYTLNGDLQHQLTLTPDSYRATPK